MKPTLRLIATHRTQKTSTKKRYIHVNRFLHLQLRSSTYIQTVSTRTSSGDPGGGRPASTRKLSPQGSTYILGCIRALHGVSNTVRDSLCFGSSPVGSRAEPGLFSRVPCLRGYTSKIRTDCGDRYNKAAMINRSDGTMINDK